MNGILHLGNDDIADTVDLSGRDVEIELIVDLHRHLRFEAFRFEATMDRDHRHLDDVRSRSLNRCINGIAFRERAHGSILGMDIRQVAFATEERLGVTALPRQLFLGLYITDHARESSEVIVDELFGFRAGAVELLRQAKGRNTVYNTEIGRFGFTPLIFGDLIQGLSVYTRSRSGMDILSGTESGKHMFVLREMRHETQFDLAIIGAEEQTSLVRDDRFADESSPL